jgi:hypothetical protein
MAIYFPTAVEYKAETSVSIRRLEVNHINFIPLTGTNRLSMTHTLNGNPQNKIWGYNVGKIFLKIYLLQIYNLLHSLQ